jgi:PKD repeat protein
MMKCLAVLLLCCGLAVAAQKPLPLTVTPSSGTVPLTVEFVTTCPTCLVYTWNFGDGGTAGGGPNQTYVYKTTGTYYVVVAAFDGKGNTYIATPIIQVKPAMIICGLRPGTSKSIASCASGNTPCQQPDGSFVATAGQKIQFGILGSDGRCTVQK